MLVALEFYVRCLDLRHNLPIPCSLCLEGENGDRKVVTLNEAYRQPDVIAVRHWHLSDCAGTQALPAISEKLVPRQQVFDSDFVVVPDHRLMHYRGHFIPSGLNTQRTPMSEETFSTFYNNFLRTDAHLHHKEVWIWREFIKAYIPYMSSFFVNDERDEFTRLRDLMSLIQHTQAELWHKWLHWRRYMLDFAGLPGEIAFCREYGDAVFTFA